MKKNLLLFSALFCLLFSAVAQDEDAPLDRGFYLKLGLNMPSSSYLNYTGAFSEFAEEVDYGFKPGFHFELGNRFPIGPVIAEKFRFGLDVTWFSANSNSAEYIDTYTTYDDDFNEITVTETTEIRMVNIQPLKFGPSVSFAINDDMAVDLKYSAVPTIAVDFVSYGDGDMESGDGFVGLNNEIGLEYRWKVLSAGFAYQFGTLYSSDDIAGDFGGLKSNTTRLLLGVKF